ncbi:MAG TPA: urease accessory protein UreE, partial [Rubrivivax sp.]|nr:urease accessory protein UreE [Rubrivivax sp.]
GNRHVAVDLKPDHLKLEPDHVLAAMLQRMHLVVSQDNDAFEPEGGAYQPAHGHHGHHELHTDHAHDSDHDHGDTGHTGHDH